MQRTGLTTEEFQSQKKTKKLHAVSARCASDHRSSLSSQGLLEGNPPKRHGPHRPILLLRPCRAGLRVPGLRAVAPRLRGPGQRAPLGHRPSDRWMWWEPETPRICRNQEGERLEDAFDLQWVGYPDHLDMGRTRTSLCFLGFSPYSECSASSARGSARASERPGWLCLTGEQIQAVAPGTSGRHADLSDRNPGRLGSVAEGW